ncbi:hypothetical protein [Sulfurovum sp.]|uniref:hypothetical protein n=1 Tax=Sulfurovum sp. TaxID=1969726 RepID=UPI0035685129
MAKVKQTKEELISHLKENLGFLKASATSFDNGNLGEAKRLAVSIRVLLHDTKQSKSLFRLLKLKQDFDFLDTAHDYDPANLISHHGLVGLRISSEGSSYIAFLGDGPNTAAFKNISFSQWWNKIVISDSKKNQFTRKELILALANKDGGAHVDPNLDEAYAHLTRYNSVGWISSSNGKETPMNHVELFSVRQIAYEFIESLEKYIDEHKL